MPAALVQKSVASGITGPASATISGVTAGNFLTVQLSCGDYGSPALPTDTHGTWTSALNSGAGGSDVVVAFQPGTSAGTHDATTAISTYGWTMTICEWSSMDPTSALDIHVAVTNGTTFTGTVTVPSQTLAQADELVLGTFNLLDSNGVTNAAITDPPSGFTSLAVQDNTTNANGYCGAEHCYIASNGGT